MYYSQVDIFLTRGGFNKAKGFDYYCAIMTKSTVDPTTGENVQVRIAVCIRLDGRFQDNNELSAGLRLSTLKDTRNINPRPIIEIERSYSSAARRGIFGRMAFEMRVTDGTSPSPAFGPSYKSTVVYSLEIPASRAAQTILDHD